MVSRIGSFAQNQIILNATLNTRARLFESQTQVASGKRSQTFFWNSRGFAASSQCKSRPCKVRAIYGKYYYHRATARPYAVQCRPIR